MASSAFTAAVRWRSIMLMCSSVRPVLLVETRLHDPHAVGIRCGDKAEGLLGRAGQPRLECASSVRSTGLRSWLIVLVRAFGSVVMNENTSMSTLGPSFLMGPVHCR